MNEIHDTKKGAGAKIAFLGLFVAALLAARVVVALRSAVVLSTPIPLAPAGLSIAVPEGNGWINSGQWEYGDNSFILSSILSTGRSRPTGSARCRYLLAAEASSPESRFERERDKLGGTIVETGQMQTETVSFDWVHIEKQNKWVNAFYGTAKLPYNRQLDIEIHETLGKLDMAKEVFRRIAESVSLTETPLLEAGAQVVAEMKAKGIADYLEDQNRQALFLIRDTLVSTGSAVPLGFAADVLIDTGRTGPSRIQAASLHYIRGRYIREQVTSFQSDNRFDELTWKIQTTGVGRRSAEIALDADGVLTITKLGEPIEEKSCYPSSAAIPDILLEQFIGRMIESDKKEVIVDVIEATGRIMPTHISSAEPDESTADNGISYKVKIEPLDGKGFYQWVYLDDKKLISESISREERIYVFESVTPDEAVRLFPERAEHILNSERFKEYLKERQ